LAADDAVHVIIWPRSPTFLFGSRTMNEGDLVARCWPGLHIRKPKFEFYPYF
jgi:hypothetical protein